ncbi:hypothetical protein PPERSA_12638 [Pseudocohnilembus persalinus]|uniref:Uncharacterized protein n=1 Tax=Pseudocohnilembus persalinus TaxID=266149 RepID=A0A0V0QCU8_PSEPJ|nr:hypothetical protein PPERSA_12638 [Pseudocohnilembus persalinus]|eukprot:KRW99962.1 hypothetical protein PPERSA_12638 [Pseudocohnilembus persalinus]
MIINNGEALKIADDRNEKIKKDLNQIAEEKAILEEQLKHHDLMIANRDSEIKRLQGRLDLGSVNMDKLSDNFQISSLNEKIERLNHQIDFLTKENEKLERDNNSQKSELTRTKTMRDDNAELQRQLYDMNQKLQHAKYDLQNQQNSQAEFKNSLQSD